MRADASVEQGSGHVMRCLTLACGLRERGHEVSFLSSIDGVPWLSEHLVTQGFRVQEATADRVSIDQLESHNPDWVVVDSYRFSPSDVSSLREIAKTLVIVDGPADGVLADLFLNGNLGAERLRRDSSWLIGAPFALVRQEWIDIRNHDPGVADENGCHVLAVMGGTDPMGSVVEVARALVAVADVGRITIVAPDHCMEQVLEIAVGVQSMRVVRSTSDLPTLVATADVVVTASGSSAWDVCTAAKPTVLIAVVENQRDSLDAALTYGVAKGIDAIGNLSAIGIRLGSTISPLLLFESTRHELMSRCRSVFDGQGVTRVVQAMESA